tara:strand:+ start:6356 stop:7489 length:1134 start_codon:yes stop_codon:yes gene_type:complete
VTKKNNSLNESNIHVGILDKDSSDFYKIKSFSDKYNRLNSVTFDNLFFDWQYETNRRLISIQDNGFYYSKNSANEIIGYCSASNAPYIWQGKRINGRFFHEWYADSTQTGSAAALLAKQIHSAPILQVMGASIQNLNVLFRMRKFLWFPLRRLGVTLNPKKTALLIENNNNNTEYLLKALSFQSASKNYECDSAEIDIFDNEYQKVWNNVSQQFFATVDKSSDYMNWRYVEHPLLSYNRYLYIKKNGLRVYIIWRTEYVEEHNVRVARICEIIGQSNTFREVIPRFLNDLLDQEIDYADFFCTNSSINDALQKTGFYEVINLEDLDIPRLFSPLKIDFRKTLHSVISFSSDLVVNDDMAISTFYFTKGDVNQDMPNR